MTDTVLRNRDIDSGNVSPDRFGRPFVYGAIGFLAYATSSNPTAEALSSTTDATAGHVYNASGSGLPGGALAGFGSVALVLTAGTIEVPRDGYYRLKLWLTNVTAASNSGVFLFAIQKNAAALTNVRSIGWTNAAAVLPGVHGHTESVVSLAKGDLIRAVFTGSVGGIVTVGTGELSVEQVTDATAYTPV